MFKGLKHTVGCKCGQTTIPCDNMDHAERIEKSGQKSECCKSTFEYVGLQPYHESILAVPIVQISRSAPVMNTIVETTSVEVEAPQIIKEVIPENKIETTKPTSVGNGIEGLIEAGPKGLVTNTQMIPVLKELVDKNDITNIELLKNTYPDVYAKSIKYLPKKYQDKLIQ